MIDAMQSALFGIDMDSIQATTSKHKNLSESSYRSNGKSDFFRR